MHEICLTSAQLITSAYEADVEYHTAESELSNAFNAIHTAQRENRTIGLNDAQQLVILGFQALNAGNYSGASQLAGQVQVAAERATIPTPPSLVELETKALLTTTIGNVLLASVALAVVVAAAIVIRPKIKRSSHQGNKKPEP